MTDVLKLINMNQQGMGVNINSLNQEAKAELRNAIGQLMK